MAGPGRRSPAGLRRAMVANCRWALAHRDGFRYEQVRPIPFRLERRQLPVTTDCSGFVTVMAQWSGIEDPNGRGYNGEGYTGTLLEHLPAVGFGQTQPGDIAVFGTFPGVHCAVLLEAGRPAPGPGPADPWAVSHGVPGDPRRTRLSRLVDFFRPDGPVVFLQLPAG
ncbi:MAG TPA: hypothetical protein VGD68_12345 [Streptosporangiaceae bacterium]